MAISKDSSRGTFYITYKLRLPNGEVKTRNIRNKDWTKKGIVKNIENQEIEKDKKKVLGEWHDSEEITWSQLKEMYLQDLSLRLKKQTYYAVTLKLNKYLDTYIDDEEEIVIGLKPTNIARIIPLIYSDSKQYGLTNKAYNDTCRILKDMVNFAVDREYIPYDYFVKSQRLLKPAKYEKHHTENLEYWTPEQFEKFINTFNDKDQKWKAFFNVCYWGALRIGEILGLKWCDVDFEKKTININKTLDRQGNIESTKNESSNANVDLPTWLMEDLKQYKLDYNATDNMWVFFGMRHSSRTSAKRVMDDHAKMCDLPHIKIHGLRHSMASRMINAGLNPLIVSKHLRHSSTQQTLDTYSHLFPKLTQGVMDNL